MSNTLSSPALDEKTTLVFLKENPGFGESEGEPDPPESIPNRYGEMPKEENSDPFPLGVAISGGFAWAMLEDGWMDALPLLELGG